MSDVEINYKILRKIQELEKKSPVLTGLKSNFYESVKNYLRELDDALENESSEKKQELFRDELDNIKRIALNVYEQREKKVVLAAVARVRGGKPDISKMLDIEKSLFDSVINIMQDSRNLFFKIKDEPTKQSVPYKMKEEEKKTTEPVNNSSKEPVEKVDNNNPIIRITENIPEFIGTDEKKYHLRNNDVISIPENMSDMLVKRGVAKKINHNY
jgi:DNA replication initiation complex subunit (GINS family)